MFGSVIFFFFSLPSEHSNRFLPVSAWNSTLSFLHVLPILWSSPGTSFPLLPFLLCHLPTGSPSHPLISASSMREARGWPGMTEACCPSLSFAREDIHNGSWRAWCSLRILPNVTLHTVIVSWSKVETGRGCICRSAPSSGLPQSTCGEITCGYVVRSPGFYVNFTLIFWATHFVKYWDTSAFKAYIT